ncbi:MAG: sulfate adenylyltransferase, partial [Pseudomonadota bacterium]|nr:sulfate adenylyltransferase [Pseudomonadota bacterium]
EAIAPQSIQVTLDDEIDISRGDLIASNENTLPNPIREFDAMICWFSEAPLDRRRKYLIKHANRTVKAIIERIGYTVDINTLEQKHEQTIQVNDIAHIHLKVLQPIMAEPYRDNRKLGAFILIDESTNLTVAGGMIEKA